MRFDARRSLAARMATGELRPYPTEGAGYSAYFRDLVFRATFFEVTDAARLYEDRAAQPGHRWRATDFPRLLPPFPLTWWEYRGQADARRPGLEVRTGVLMNAFGVELGASLDGFKEVSLALPGARWLVVALPINLFPGDRLRAPLFSYNFALAEDGSALTLGDGKLALVPNESPAVAKLSTPAERRDVFLRKVAGEFFAYLGPVFEALKLLHCRNVDDGGSYNTTREDRRAIERVRGSPCPGNVVFRTLRVTDGPRPRRIGVVDRERETDPEARRLHAVRGHYANYGESAPLFGRLIGTFWRPAHVRGTRERGEVQKGYDVGPGGKKEPCSS